MQGSQGQTTRKADEKRKGTEIIKKIENENSLRGQLQQDYGNYFNYRIT